MRVFVAESPHAKYSGHGPKIVFPGSMLRLFLALFALTPTTFFATEIVFAGTGDNANYLIAYRGLSENSLTSAFRYFVLGTGGFEPISFLYFYILSMFGAPYEIAVFVKNILFDLSLSLILASIFRSKFFWFLLVCLSLSVSPYILALHSELHRLSIALIFLNVSVFAFLGVRRKGAMIGIALSILSHVQAAVFLIFFWKILMKRLWMIILFFMFGGTAFYLLIPFVLEKLRYYLENPIGDAVQTAVFWFFSIGFISLFSRKFIVGYSVFATTIAIASIIVGGGRLNIFLIFTFIAVVSYEISGNRVPRTGRLTFALVLFLLIPYDVYRSLIFYEELMVESVGR